MRWIVVCLLIAGCSELPAEPEPEPPGPVVPPPWQDGQWWTYSIVPPGGDAVQATLVADLDERRLLASASGPVLSSTADGFGFTGTYDNWTRHGLVTSGYYGESEVRMAWLPARLGNGTSWTSGTLKASVTAFDGDNATIEYAFLSTRVDAVYSLRAGWFTHLRLPSGETWRLLDAGTGYEGEVWAVEQVVAVHDVLGTMLVSYPSGGASVVRFTYDLACTEPGAIEFRLGHRFPVAEPVVAYQDACPKAAHRVTWFEPQEQIRIEATGMQADGALYGLGSMRIDGVRVAAA